MDIQCANPIIESPAKLSSKQFNQVLGLIKARSPVDLAGLERRLRGAEWIALCVHNNQVATTATLKNPLPSYMKKFFEDAGVYSKKDNYKRELGYIATNPTF